MTHILRTVLLRVFLLLGLLFGLGVGSVFGADQQIKDAQAALNMMGYDAGTADGLVGRQTLTAIEMFYEDRGAIFDGEIDDADVDRLQAASSEFALGLRYPGQLFDRTFGRETQCNNLSFGPFNPAWIEPDNYEPVLALNDALSIGDSEIWSGVEPWLKAVIGLSARYNTTGDLAAAELAVQMLSRWAAAGAILETPVDNAYYGVGAKGSYRPSASAPVLDMENAAQFGYAILYTLFMLDDAVPREAAEEIGGWADLLLQRYGEPMADGLFRQEPTGIWRLDGRPLLALAVMQGDEPGYIDLVEAYFSLLRYTISPQGVIRNNAYRGNRALHYQSQGLLSVAGLFDLVEQQGSRIPRDIVDRFHAAVAFLLDADRDNSVILEFASQGYNNPGDGTQPVRYYRESAEHYWWMAYYLARYPDHENSMRLRDFISRNGSSTRIDQNILSTIWVPYPINCYREITLDDASIAEARAYVIANYPPQIEVEFLNRIENATVQSAADFAVAQVTIREEFSEGNFVQYGLALNGAELDGDRRNISPVSIFADYKGSVDQVSNIELLRVVFMRSSLGDEESRQANYLGCGDVAVQPREGNEQQLRLHFGNASERNVCVLSLMSEGDRKLWSAVMANFENLLMTASNSDATDRLRQLYEFIVE